MKFMSLIYHIVFASRTGEGKRLWQTLLLECIYSSDLRICIVVNAGGESYPHLHISQQSTRNETMNSLASPLQTC